MLLEFGCPFTEEADATPSDASTEDHIASAKDRPVGSYCKRPRAEEVRRDMSSVSV